MAKTFAALLLGLSLALVPGCGRKGPLQLPPGQAPMPVEGLTAAAGDGAVLVRWTNPAKAVSGKPVEALEAVEIWVFERELPAAGRSLTSEEVEKKGRLVRRVPRAEFAALAGTAGEAPGAMTFSYTLPPSSAAPPKLAFTVRVFDRKGRASDFAAPAAVEAARRLAAVGPSAPGRCILRAGGRP
jgi:predicted small lipoprotein YifL